jgi:hypothetical protein
MLHKYNASRRARSFPGVMAYLSRRAEKQTKECEPVIRPGVRGCGFFGGDSGQVQNSSPRWTDPAS